MACEDVQNDISGMDTLGDGLGTGGFDSIKAIGQQNGEDLDHLPITVRNPLQLAPDAAHGGWQFPLLERRPIA